LIFFAVVFFDILADTEAVLVAKEGVARFTKQSNEKNAGFEGGSLKTNVQSAAKQNKKITLDEIGENVGGGADVNANQKLLAETEEVSVITIDTYLEKNHIQQLDMLKIDTEGNDNKVLQGANKAITSLTGVFTFEGGGGVTYSKDMDEMYNTLGYNCYSTSRAGLFKWNANCMKERYFGSFRKKDKGNIFCVHRKRAPLTALAFDILSFPAMIDFLFLHKNTTAKNGMNEAEKLAYQTLFENAVKSEEDGEMKLNMKADPTSVLPLYINIHGFCRPWPSCLSNL
jgi:FkbM family methyltransferase